MIDKYYPFDSVEARASASYWKQRLLTLELPGNALDQLIELLGGVNAVAEMTGRRKRFIRREDGKLGLCPRDPKTENLVERYVAISRSVCVCLACHLVGVCMHVVD
jgi:hypothetical protein